MSRPRLVYLVTEDWYFMAHRLPMARAAQRAGYEVHVATRVDRHGRAIEAEGFALHPIDWKRGSVSPISFLRTGFAVRRLYRSLKPELVHHVALQACCVGAAAAIGLPMAQLNAFVGLGFVFTARSLKARLVRLLIGAALPSLFGRKRTTVLVENPDDRATLADLGIAPDKIIVIAGSGVDLDHFAPLPEPPAPVTAAFVGRMVEHKGVRALVAACKRLAERGQAVRLLLAGTPDPDNPNSIPAEEIRRWCEQSTVTWLGHVDDIRTVWRRAHIAVLPSRGGEGIPMSLMEAAACGRPLIATDVPGCREIARPGRNGLLVPPDDPQALADAIGRLAADADLRCRLGAAGRRLIEAEFSSRRIGDDIVVLYDRLIGRSGGPPRSANPGSSVQRAD